MLEDKVLKVSKFQKQFLSFYLFTLQSNDGINRVRIIDFEKNQVQAKKSNKCKHVQVCSNYLHCPGEAMSYREHSPCKKCQWLSGPFAKKTELSLRSF